MIEAMIETMIETPPIDSWSNDITDIFGFTRHLDVMVTEGKATIHWDSELGSDIEYRQVDVGSKEVAYEVIEAKIKQQLFQSQITYKGELTPWGEGK